MAVERRQTPSALVVLSGGQDSTTCLFWAKQRYAKLYALSFDYAQRHQRELEAACIVADMAQAEHDVVSLGPVLKGRSPLTNPNEPLERYGSFEEMDRVIGDRVELTFVPMRNALFLTIAVNRAELLGCKAIVTGVCQQDNANYPDCRRIFIDAFTIMAGRALGNEGPRIETPLMDLSKAESVRLAKSLPGCWEALAYTHTAYDGAYPPSNDHASVLRAQGFLEAGEPDPLIERAWREGLLGELPVTPNYDTLRQ